MEYDKKGGGTKGKMIIRGCNYSAIIKSLVLLLIMVGIEEKVFFAPSL